ncbi:MAG: histone deacetylase [Candidatus Latescibacteria bacterium]|nr:histone deacetylase [Candidatus Latescibacterota bacterium]
MTGILYHEDFVTHSTGMGHPEQPSRVTAIVETLKKEKYNGRLVWDGPRLAAEEEIEYIHSESYIKRVIKTCESAPDYLDSYDNPVSDGSYQAALRASGALLTAVDGVIEGKYTNAFCPVRPPGHHARHSMAMGFCIFNNIAIAARHLKNKHNIHKILIVDFDVHHCNGTEESLSGDNDILLFSIHQHPHYPGTGMSSKLYSHSGGVLNVPMPPGSAEEDYMKVIKGQLSDQVNMFMPDFVLISAGFDAHKDDPLGDILLESETFYRMTEIAVEFANMYCDGKVVSTLEGGYNLDALAESAAFHVDALLEAGK